MFFTLFGAVAIVGVLGAGIMSTMRGPLSTMVEVNRIEETKAEMGVSLRLILLRGSQLDGDTLTEPTAPAACSIGAAGAGCVPGNTGAKQKDAWGTSYAYCAWNNGSENDAITGILAGEVSTNNVAVALISAGSDRKFDTDCQTNPGSGSGFQVLVPNGGGGDDIVRSYNYNDAVAGSDGLWALQTEADDNDIARVEEEISVGGGAGSVSTFEGSGAFQENVRTEGQLQTDIISPFPGATPLDYIEFTGSVLLPELTGLSCAGNEGAIAYNETEGIVSFCDGDSWEPLGKKLWIEDTNGIRNNTVLAPHVGIGAASDGTLSLNVGGGTKTDTLGATGAVNFDTTLNVDGASTLRSTFEVVGVGTSKLGGTLDVVGNTELDASLGVDGQSEFRGDVTVISDVFIEKSATGGGNLNAQDAITAEEGDITATAGDVVATSGDVIATAGDVTATAGNVTAGESITAENDITATTGDISATAGNMTAGGYVEAGGNVYGDAYFFGTADSPGVEFSAVKNCDLETEKLVWSTISGWDCKPDNGTGSGTDGESTIKDVLARGNDADGADIDDVGTLSADEFCDNVASPNQSCLSATDLVKGSSIWKKDGPGSATGEIYYNGGYVGIGTNDPARALNIQGGGGVEDDILMEANSDGADYMAAGIVMARSRGTGSSKTLPVAGDFLGVISARGWNGTGYPGGEGAAISFVAETDYASAISNYIDFATTHNGIGSGKVRISAIGSMGVGTVDPNTKLDVAGTMKMGDGGEECVPAPTDTIDHTGAIRFVAADNAFEVCADETKGWESLFSSGDKGGLWEPNDSDTPTHIRYDDALGGMRVGHVSGAPPLTGWQIAPLDSLVFTNNKVGALEYCDPSGANCFAPADVGGAVTDPLGGYNCATGEVLSWDGSDWVCSASASDLWKNDGPGGTSKVYYSGGNVGVGTDDPGTDLHVNADRNGFAGLYVTNANTGTASSADILFGASDTGMQYGYLSHHGANFVADGLREARRTVLFAADTGGLGLIAAGTGAPMLFATGGYNGSSERMRITGAGLIGMGTIDPKTALDIGGTLKIGDGTELCNAVDHEGALKYDDAGDNFYMCRNSATGWELLGSGSGGGGFGQDVSFRVHKNGTSQSVTASSWTKLTWSTEVFDTNNNFSGDKFTPTVAGKYLVTATIECFGVPTNGYCAPGIYKNGAIFMYSSSTGSGNTGDSVSVVVEMNGTTDYLEAYAVSGGTSISGSITTTSFSGALIGGGGGTDTLAGLSCTSGQVAAWDGDISEWACADAGFSGGGAADFSNAVMAFAATSCPAGWSEYTPARGRFLRGIDNGAGNDPDGTRAPGAVQADAFQGHQHSYSMQPGTLDNPYNISGTRWSAPTPAATSGYIADGTNGTPRTSDETRPKNAAVIFCKYDGTTIGGGSGPGIGFTAKGPPTNQSVSVGGVLDWDILYTDEGAGFDLAQNRYIAPLAGLYFFHADVLTPNDTSSGDLRFHKNGVDTGMAAYGGNFSTAAHKQSTLSMVASLNAGDYIDIRAATATNVLAGGHTRFSGFLIGSGGSGTDTLAGLACTSGQVAAWDGGVGEWVCTDMGAGGGSMAPGKGITIKGSVTSSTSTFFGATVESNTLVSPDPTTSDITLTESGGYLLSGSVATCIGGATQGNQIELWVNGAAVEFGFSIPNPCASASVVEFVSLNAGDKVGAKCFQHQGLASACTFTAVLVSSGSGSDTLAGLTCTSGQVAQWDGDSWDCGTVAGGGSWISGSDPSCGDIGDQCGDGTYYVGQYGGVSYFTNSSDAPTTLTWASGGALRGTNSLSDGATSTATLAGFGAGAHPAAEYCAGLNTNGHEDWFLPAREELDLVYANRALLPGVWSTGGNGYASTTEVDNSNRQAKVFNSAGTWANISKIAGSYVRCVRKGAPGFMALQCAAGEVAEWDGSSWQCGEGGGGSGSDVWSDSGDGYLEYSVVDAGVKIAKIAGLPNPDVPLADGLIWDADTSTLHVDGNIEITGELTDASDARLKEDIRSLGDQGSLLEKIRAIDPVSFRMKKAGNGRTEFGVIAQQLETVFPELVFTQEGEAGLKSVNYVGLIAPLIGAAQELDLRNEALRIENEALRGEVAEFRQAVESDRADISDLKSQVALLSKIAGAGSQKAVINWQIILFMLFGGAVFALLVIAPHWKSFRKK